MGRPMTPVPIQPIRGCGKFPVRSENCSMKFSYQNGAAMST
jgi:hypothetical protein